MAEKAPPEIEYEDTNAISFAPWNPPGRTSDRNLRKLLESMRRDGFWAWEPIQLARLENEEGEWKSGKWVDADGNRRLRAAQILGIDRVPVVRVKTMSAQEYWAKKNGTIKPPTIRETGEAISRGLRHIPPNHARHIEDLLEIYNNDWDKLKEMFEGGTVSPAIIACARRIANYTGFKGDSEFIVRAITWMIKHRMSLTVSRAISDGVDAEALYDKIAKDEPLKNLYG